MTRLHIIWFLRSFRFPGRFLSPGPVIQMTLHSDAQHCDQVRVCINRYLLQQEASQTRAEGHAGPRVERHTFRRHLALST